MGLADRDYMRRDQPAPEKRRRRSGPPEPSAAATLWIVVGCFALTFAGYRTWHYFQPARQQLAAPSPAPASPRERTGPVRVAPVEDRMMDVPDTRSQAQPSVQVTKCVVNGRTVYSDLACPPNARSSIVTLKTGENLADALPAPVRQEALRTQAQPLPAPAPDVVAIGPDIKAICAALEQEVKAIDAAARQPLPASEQDRLAARRKNARDREFRLGC